MTASNRPIDDKRLSLSRSDNPALAADPPAASGAPLSGQTETNQAASSQSASADDNDTGSARKTAYDFGRRAALKEGRDRSSPLEFELHEAQLQRQWAQEQPADGNWLSWQEARESARDAWNKVQDAIAGQ